MAHDEQLAARVRRALAGIDAVEERKMFGGLCFMVRGHMACGITGAAQGGELMVRVGKDAYEAALAREHAKEMTFTGRSMRGMIYVDPAGFRSDGQLSGWVAMGVEHAQSLPPKKPRAKKKR
ncbi:MAG: TfoX/Sxy family protein [Sandaracinaceae bacterium]